MSKSKVIVQHTILFADNMSRTYFPQFNFFFFFSFNYRCILFSTFSIYTLFHTGHLYWLALPLFYNQPFFSFDCNFSLSLSPFYMMYSFTRSKCCSHYKTLSHNINECVYFHMYIENTATQ